VIPCLDVDAGRVVKGVRFADLRDAGDPVELAAAYDAAGADELVFLDVTASADERATMLDVVSRTAESVFIPLTVGGGIRAVSDVDILLRAGADKVGVNTAAIARPELIAEIADRFGRQVLTLSLDVRRSSGRSSGLSSGPSSGFSSGPSSGFSSGPPSGFSSGPPSGFEVTTHGGRRGAGLDAIEWAVRGAALGAGEILLNSMDRDGTKDGFDLSLIASVRAAVDIPVIASGGAGSLEHFAPAVAVGADAVLAASVFHFGQFSIGEVKDALRAAGHPVR
jgi:cyclase